MQLGLDDEEAAALLKELLFRPGYPNRNLLAYWRKSHCRGASSTAQVYSGNPEARQEGAQKLRVDLPNSNPQGRGGSVSFPVPQPTWIKSGQGGRGGRK